LGEVLNSPEFIKTSLAAAISLGLEPGRFKDNVRLTGLNLLLTYDSGCIGKCSYCGISISNSKYEGYIKDSGKENIKNNINSETKSNINKGNINRDSNNDNSNCIRSSGNDDIYDVNSISKKAVRKTFIRVKWPVYRLSDVLAALKSRENQFERICLSMITHRNAVKDTVFITQKIKEASKLPISILITPTLINSPLVLEEFRKAGAEMVGIAIDASTEEIFEKHRGRGVGGPHKWEKYWEVLKWAVEVFGKFKAGIHLIVGLGETEREAVQIIYNAHVLGAKTHLFSFYPETNTGLENLNLPELLVYRKIQIARFLINEKNYDISQISFDTEGKIISFNYNLKEVLDDCYAFMTSGCPCSTDGKTNISACNRPFANERPSEFIRNYPYIPMDEDRKIIEKQIESLIN